MSRWPTREPNLKSRPNKLIKKCFYVSDDKYEDNEIKFHDGHNKGQKESAVELKIKIKL